MDSIILVQKIAAAIIAKKLQLCCVNVLYALGSFSNRDTFVIADKERNLI